MLVLGIDPGLRITGYGCIRAGGGARHHIVEAGVFRLARAGAEDTAEASGVSRRLVELDRDFRDLLARVKPDAVGVEGIFTHPERLATSAIMGHARGVLLLAIAQAGLRLVELKPALVKKTMTGSGRADKPQMQRAVQDYFALPHLPTPPDVADALAIALAATEHLRMLDGLGVPASTRSRARTSRRTPPPALRRLLAEQG